MCKLKKRASQQSSSSGDLLPEMMESETPPPAIPPHEAGDLEVSSLRVSPDPQGQKVILWPPEVLSIRLLKRAIERVRHHLVCGRTYTSRKQGYGPGRFSPLVPVQSRTGTNVSIGPCSCG